MKHFALTYEFGPDLEEERKPHRSTHLAYLNQLADADKLVLAGAFADLEGSLLVFKAENAAEVERIAASDPYVTAGVAKSWRVREWVTVVGKGALTKVVLV